MSSVLERFSPATREWFSGAFARATDAQLGAWKAISGGGNALVVAPTGSGKTLAAFLWAIDRLAAGPPPAERMHRTRVLYISPLKALGGRAARREPVDRPEERRERLAGAGGRHHECVAAAGDRLPGTELRVSGLREGAREPLPRGGAEPLEHRAHAAIVPQAPDITARRRC